MISDPVLRALTREYFLLLKLEDKSNNPKIAADADTLQKVITEYKKQNPLVQ